MQVADEVAEPEVAADAPPSPRKVRPAKRRGSVFVEAVQVSSNWEAPSYPKSADEVERLRGYVSRTVLLCHLDFSAKETVIGSFQKKEIEAGHDIITQVREGGGMRERDRERVREREDIIAQVLSR